jgi:signal recognition particle subunit SRP54
MFLSTANKFSNLVNKIKGSSFSEKELESISIDIRNILLEADVPLDYIKDFLQQLNIKLSKSTVKSSDKQAVLLKIIEDHMIKTLGCEFKNITLDSSVKKIMLIGSNGVGKTSFLVKFANILKKQSKKDICCFSFDKVRPAAQLQLKKLCLNNNIDYFDLDSDDLQENAALVNKIEKSGSFPLMLIDTPGINHNDKKAIQYLLEIKQLLNIDEVWLVIDGTFGQNVVNIINAFTDILPIDSFIVTKMDSDQRGGVIFSIKYLSDKPIRYLTDGEKIDDIKEFHPDRITKRILGKGDMKQLIETANKTVDKKEIETIAQRIVNGNLNFEDLLLQLNSIKKMGGLPKIASLVPGLSSMVGKIDSNMINYIDKQIAIIGAMTTQERLDPKLVLENSRATRIAKGASVKIQDVFDIKKRLDETQKMLSKNKHAAHLISKIKGNA